MLSTEEPATEGDLYSELGVEPSSPLVAVVARIGQERDHSNLLKKIPKRRAEAETRLTHLAEIERVLTDSNLRADYDARLHAFERVGGAVPTRVQNATPKSVPTQDSDFDSFCMTCGLSLADGAKFCEDCGATTKPGENAHPNPPIGGPVSNDEPSSQIVKDSDAVTKATSDSAPALPVLPLRNIQTPSRDDRSSFPVVLTVLIVLLFAVVGGMLWYFNRQPAQQPVTTVPPIPGQVTDLRPAQVSLLNSPILTTSPVASWDTQNIHGLITIKSDNGVQSILYPNGSQYTLDAKLFSASSAGSVKFSNDYHTVLVDSAYPLSQNSSSTWQVQLQSDQAKDINGDGFPEIVLSDFSGGAHCCTTIAVISLRPQGPFVVFDQSLGSGNAVFTDLDGDGRLEIRYPNLFEYALGSFAQGTFGIPVIYSAGKDGVYRVNTRAFAQIMSNEYDTAAGQHQTAKYDSATGAMEEDRDLIDMFFLAYLAGRRTEGFDAISRLKPLVDDDASKRDPIAILEEALKNAAPEVLQEPEWTHLKSGQAVDPERGISPVQTASADSATREESQTQIPAFNMTQWIDGFLKAGEGPPLENLKGFFDTTVSPYFGHATAGWEVIAQDKNYYFDRFPHIEYTLEGEPHEVKGSAGEETIEFDVRYTNIRKDGKPMHGISHSWVSLRFTGGRWKVVGIREGKSSATPAQAATPATPTQGILRYSGPPVLPGESIAFSNLPGGRLKLSFDQQSWQPLISRQPDGTQKLTLRSLKGENQIRCDVQWEMQ